MVYRYLLDLQALMTDPLDGSLALATFQMLIKKLYYCKGCIIMGWHLILLDNVNTLYCVPVEYALWFSAMLLKYVTRYSRKSLRVLGSVGEPINPSAWRWVVLCQLLTIWGRKSINGHMSDYFVSDGSTTLLGTPGAPYQTLGGKLKLVVSW